MCRAHAVFFFYCTKNTVVFVYRGSVPCKCRDLGSLFRDCRGFRLLRKRAEQMPLFLIIVPRLQWLSITAKACRANTVVASNRAMIYRISILRRRQPYKTLYPMCSSSSISHTVRKSHIIGKVVLGTGSSGKGGGGGGNNVMLSS